MGGKKENRVYTTFQLNNINKYHSNSETSCMHQMEWKISLKQSSRMGYAANLEISHNFVFLHHESSQKR